MRRYFSLIVFVVVVIYTIGSSSPQAQITLPLLLFVFLL